ncbi:MAG: LOG family protein [Lentisphaerae bacterium]|nr:LOG family protein [Lentisphaerota bacterium]
MPDSDYPASATPLKAYEDLDFLKKDICRGLRLQLEFLKPDYMMDQLRVESTIVIFGSARTLPPDVATKRLQDAQADLARQPNDLKLQAALKRAERMLKESHFYQVARDFSALITRECQSRDLRKLVVITDGGGGIMEAGNRGAADMGGISAALNITLPFEQHPNPYITPELSFLLHYFSIRKMHFLKRAKGLCCFPGGFGTMDELFEALTLVQTHKIPPMPILLFGKEFWEELINWNTFVERGLISPEDVNLFSYCETAQDGWEALRTFHGL